MSGRQLPATSVGLPSTQLRAHFTGGRLNDQCCCVAGCSMMAGPHTVSAGGLTLVFPRNAELCAWGPAVSLEQISADHTLSTWPTATVQSALSSSIPGFVDSLCSIRSSSAKGCVDSSCSLPSTTTSSSSSSSDDAGGNSAICCIACYRGLAACGAHRSVPRLICGSRSVPGAALQPPTGSDPRSRG